MKLTDVSRDSRSFVRLAVAMMRAKRAGEPLASFAEASGLTPRLKEILANPRLPMILKGSVTTADDMGYGDLSNAFLASVAQFSVFERAFQDGAFKQIPVHVANIRVMSSDDPGSTVAESDLMPVLRLTADLADPLQPIKSLAVCVADSELLEIGDAEAASLIGSSLRKSVAVAVDSKFLDLITAGAATTPSTGLSAGAVLADISSALGQITAGSDARYYLAVSPDVYKTMSVAATSGGQLAFPNLGVNSGMIGAVKIVASDSATDGVLFDAGQVAASAGPVVLDTSIESAAQVDDNPTGSSRMLSFFQDGLTGIRVTRLWSAKPLRTTAVCSITGMSSATVTA